MAKVDLYTLAKENGYTDEEFLDEIGRCYATNISMLMDSMGETIVCEHSVEFEGYTLQIQCRKKLKDTRTIN